MAQYSPHFGRRNRSRNIGDDTLPKTFQVAHYSPSSSSRSLPPPISDRSELKVALQQVRRESAEQGAKALAILEVKDGVIERLERELDAARSLSEERSAAQKTLLCVEEREQLLEKTSCQKQEQLEAQCHDSCQEIAQMKQELELLRYARAQAEADAVVIGRDLQTLRERNVSAERKLVALQNEASKHVGVAENVRILTDQLQQARSEVRRYAVADQMRPSEEDVVRLEGALLQSQRDLASAERELHELRRIELERSGVEASEQRMVSILNRELSDARMIAQQSERQCHDAEHRRALVQESDHVQIGRLEAELERLQGVHHNSRESHTNNDELTGWLQDSLRKHDAALADLIASIKREAAGGHWGLDKSSLQVGEQSEFYHLRRELKSLQEERRRADAKELACAEKLQHQGALLLKYEREIDEIVAERGKLTASDEERAKAMRAVEDRAAKESQEYASQKQILDLQLRERQEQLRVACKSLEATNCPHADARLGELTGHVLMLTRSEHALNRRFTQVQSESERAASACGSLESALESAENQIGKLELCNNNLIASDRLRLKEHENSEDKLRILNHELQASELQLRDAQRSLRKHGENNEAWCQRIVDLHDTHVQQLSRERITFEEQHQRLSNELRRPIPLPAVEAASRSLRELLEAQTHRKGPRKSNGVALHGVAEVFATALQQLARLERRSVLSEVECKILQERSQVAAKVEAGLRRDIAILQQEVLTSSSKSFESSSSAALPPSNVPKASQLNVERVEYESPQGAAQPLSRMLGVPIDTESQSVVLQTFEKVDDDDAVSAHTCTAQPLSKTISALVDAGTQCTLATTSSRVESDTLPLARCSAQSLNRTIGVSTDPEIRNTAVQTLLRVDREASIFAHLEAQPRNRTVAVSTDPEKQSTQIQTLPVRVYSMREVPQHESQLQEAAEAQNAVMSRVEAVLSFQKGLQMRYQNVAEEVIGLREDRAEHENRARELQEELMDSSGEIVTAVNMEMGIFEEVCNQRSEREAEAIHTAAFREAEMLGAALAEARAEVVSATRRDQHSLKEARQEMEKQQHYIMQEESALRKARHEVNVAKQQIARSAASAQEDTSVKAKAAEATSELQDECEALVLVEGAAHTAESRASEANRRLELAEMELLGAQAKLTEAKAETHQEKMEVASFGDEASKQRLVREEMKDLARSHRELVFRLESAEAGELWAEISRKEDCDKWSEECQMLQDRTRSEVRELGSRAHWDRLEQQNLEHHRTHLAEKNEHLHNEISHLSELLDSSHERCERLYDEHQLEELSSRRGDRTLQRELAAARGREAALLHELERLRDSILSRHLDPCVACEIAGSVEQARAGSQERACALPVYSDAEEDGKDDTQHQQARRTDRHEAKRLQRLLGQERNHREQQRARATAAEREVNALKDRLQIVESQLRLCKEESERRRAMVSTLQQRCNMSVADSKEEQEAARECDEARRSLNAAKREMKSKDALLHEMRQEVSEARQQRTEQRLNEEALTARSEADASRNRANRAEVQRKDQLLRSARAQVQSLEMQLAEQQRECETRGVKLRRLRAMLQNQNSSARKHSALMISSSVASICDASDIQQDHLPDVNDDISSASAYSVDIKDMEIRTDSETKSPLSHMAPQTMSALLSSIEETALEESLNILNIDRDDIAEFFT